MMLWEINLLSILYIIVHIDKMLKLTGSMDYISAWEDEKMRREPGFGMKIIFIDLKIISIKIIKLLICIFKNTVISLIDFSLAVLH